MREILFRGKRIDNDKWIEGYYWTNGIGNHFIKVIKDKSGNFVSNAINNNFEVESNTVGQYTGLTDKNGKKIYEGDILSTDNGTPSNTGQGLVKEYKGMYVSFYGQDVLGRDCYDALNRVCNAREVIGNIWENPELLK